MTNEPNPKSQFEINDRVQIHCPGSVLHGLAGTVVQVDLNPTTARFRTLTSSTAYRVLLDGDTYPIWLAPRELKEAS